MGFKKILSHQLLQTVLKKSVRNVGFAHNAIFQLRLSTQIEDFSKNLQVVPLGVLRLQNRDALLLEERKK